MSVAFEVESDSEGIFSFSSLWKAYKVCGKRKRNTINALKFEIDLLDNLFGLSESLINRTYRPSRSVCFVVKDPKFREVFAADFRDRVVHHLLVPRLETIFEPKFIFDSYSCREKKGTHAAVNRLNRFLDRATDGGKNTAWYLQLDIKSFFMNIRKDVLEQLLIKHISNESWIWLTRTILYHDCVEDFVYKGDPALMEKVPCHKSLFNMPKNKGLPIGNLTSQFFANVYLNELDQYLKHQLKCRFYLRYMDDFIMVHQHQEQLSEWKEKIKSFLDCKLDLSLKLDAEVKSVYQGIDFLGYIIRPNYRLVRRRVVGNLKSKLNDFLKELIIEGLVGNTHYRKLFLTPDRIMALRQVLASYIGHFQHADSFKLIEAIWERFDFLKEIFYVSRKRKLVPLYEPPFLPINYKGQYRWFYHRYQSYCILFQIGKYIELYGHQAEKYFRVLGVQLNCDQRGLGKQCGFPVRFLKTYQRKLFSAGVSYIIVKENGYYQSGLKKRLVLKMVRFSPKLAIEE